LPKLPFLSELVVSDLNILYLLSMEYTPVDFMSRKKLFFCGDFREIPTDLTIQLEKIAVTP
jgi:hypothetical protein